MDEGFVKLIDSLNDEECSFRDLQAIMRFLSPTPISLREYQAEFLVDKLLTKIIKLINNEKDNITEKELLLKVLYLLSEVDDCVSLVRDSLPLVDEKFTSFFHAIDDLDKEVSINMRRYLLCIFFNVIKNFKASDLLDLTDKDISKAMIWIRDILSFRSAKNETLIICTKCLLDFTNHQIYFTSDEFSNNIDISILTKTIHSNVNILLKNVVDLNLFSLITNIIKPWIAHVLVVKGVKYLSESQHLKNLMITMPILLTLIDNLIKYSSAYSKIFRTYLSHESDLITKAIIPYCEILIEMLNELFDFYLTNTAIEEITPTDKKKMSSFIQQLLLSFETLAIVSFKIKTYKQVLIKTNIVKRVLLLLLKNLRRNNIFLIEVIIKLMVNMDYYKSNSKNEYENALAINDLLKEVLLSLSSGEKEKLYNLLSDILSPLPMHRGCASYEAISFVFDIIKIIKNTIALAEENVLLKSNSSPKKYESKEEEKIVEEKYKAEEKKDYSSNKKDLLEDYLSYMCEYSGNIMEDPVRSPYGHVFERSILVDYLSENGNICPITDKHLTIDMCKSDVKVMDFIKKKNDDKFMRLITGSNVKKETVVEEELHKDFNQFGAIEKMSMNHEIVHLKSLLTKVENASSTSDHVRLDFRLDFNSSIGIYEKLLKDIVSHFVPREENERGNKTIGGCVSILYKNYRMTSSLYDVANEVTEQRNIHSHEPGLFASISSEYLSSIIPKILKVIQFYYKME